MKSQSSRTVSIPHVSTSIAPPRTGEHDCPRIEAEVQREKNQGHPDLIGVLPRHLHPRFDNYRRQPPRGNAVNLDVEDADEDFGGADMR